MTLITLLIYIAIAAVGLSLFLILGLKVYKSILMTYIQSFCGLLLIFSGWVKAVDPLGTAIKMQDYFAEFTVTFESSGFSFLAPLFPMLSNHSTAFALIMIIFEIILGVMLIIGAKPKLTAWLFLILMIFFTILTGFTFLTGYVPSDANFFSFSQWSLYNESNMRVTDCGCFGDFIKLKPETSFYKDIFLMIPAVYFLWRHKDMHQLFSPSTRTSILTVFFVILPLYCTYNFYWNEPHVDFRPFRNGTDVRAIRKSEMDATAQVKVIAYKLKDKKTGELITLSSEDYLKDLAKVQEQYETVDQVKTVANVEATKISEFDVTDFNGDEKTDLYFDNPKPHFMINIYAAKYKAIPTTKMISDTTFTIDSFAVVGKKDSFQVVKNLKNVEQKEVKTYDFVWDEGFIKSIVEHIKPVYEGAQKDGIMMTMVISGIDQEKADLLKKEVGMDIAVFTADEKLLKTIMRSNPGLILWQNGVLVHKWHHKHIPSYAEIKSTYLK